MEKQYKWYKLDLDNLMETYNEIKKEPNIKLKEVKANEILVEYEYGGSSDYKNIIETMSKYNVSQKIMTASRFCKLLSAVLDYSDINIFKIQLLECLEEENKIITSKVREVNKERNGYSLEKLIEELGWLNTEGIDINCVELRTKVGKIFYDFQIFSNGVVFLDDEKILDKVIKFLSNI